MECPSAGAMCTTPLSPLQAYLVKNLQAHRAETFNYAAISSHAPMVRWRRSKMKCWLSPGTIKLIKKKRLVYRRLKRSFSDSCLRRYKQLRNLVRQLTRVDYCAYADKISGSLFSDQKAFWSWILIRLNVVVIQFLQFYMMALCLLLMLIKPNVLMIIFVPYLLLKIAHLLMIYGAIWMLVILQFFWIWSKPLLQRCLNCFLL